MNFNNLSEKDKILINTANQAVHEYDVPSEDLAESPEVREYLHNTSMRLHHYEDWMNGTL